MNNITKRIILTNGVDASGKAATIADDSLRYAKNCIPDKELGFLVRRGVIRHGADLFRPAAELGGSVGGNQQLAGEGVIADLNRLHYPVWCAVPNERLGVIIGAACQSLNSLDVFVSIIGGSGWVTRALAVAPEFLPCTFQKDGVTHIIFGENPKGRGGVKIVSDVSAIGFHLEDFSFNGTGNEGFKPNLVTEYKNRAVYAQGHKVIFSDIDDYLTVGNSTLTDRNFNIGIDNDKIRCLKGISLVSEGVPSQSAVFIGKMNGITLITGDPSETDDLDYFGSADVITLKSPAGCVSNDAFAATPWGHIWCGPDDVWFMPFGARPIPIGRKISSILKAQPRDQMFRIHAIYHDGFFRLALFSDGQGPTLQTPLGEQWWLDLRDGPPDSWKTARWYGPQIFNPTNQIAGTRGINHTTQGTWFMCLDPRQGALAPLIGVQEALILLASFTHTTSAVVVTYDSPDPRDISAVHRDAYIYWQASTFYSVGDEIVVEDAVVNIGSGVAALVIFRVSAIAGAGASGSSEPDWGTGSSFVDNEVTWTRIGYVVSPAQVRVSEALIDVHGKQYDFGTRSMEKLFKGVEIDHFLTVPERIKVIQLLDGGKTTDTINKDLTNTSGPELGTDLLEISGDLNMAEEHVMETWFSGEDDRKLGRSGQIQISEVGGIIIPDIESDVAGYTSLDVGFVVGGVEYFATLTDRYYANATALVNAIIAAAAAKASLPTVLKTLTLTSFRLHVIITGTSAWAPSIASNTIRHIWQLLGLRTWNRKTTPNAEATVINGDEIPYDNNTGDIALNEVNMLVGAFNRRPRR